MFLYTFWIRYRLPLAWLVSFLVLILASLFHVSIGAKTIEWHVIVEAFLNFDPTQYLHQIVIKQRFTRLVVALFCGAALGNCRFCLTKTFSKSASFSRHFRRHQWSKVFLCAGNLFHGCR